MKKTLVILAALAAIFACTKADLNEPEDSLRQEDTQCITLGDVEFDINVGLGGDEPATKAIKKKCVSGDKIFLWLNGDIQQTPDITLYYNGTKWFVSAQRTSSLPLTNGNRVAAIYSGNNSITGGAWSYSTSTVSGSTHGVISCTRTRAGEKYSYYPMIATCNSNYKLTSTTLTINLNDWFFVTQTQIVIKGLPVSKNDYYVLECNELYPVSPIHLTNDGIRNVVEEVPNNAAVGVNKDGEVAFYFGANTKTGYAQRQYTLTLKRFSSNSSSTSKLQFTSSITLLAYIADTYGEYCYGVSCGQYIFSQGTAGVNSSTGGRSSCEWVQLWDGGPKFAKFNVMATITSYANLSATYNNPNVGGLFAWRNPNENSRSSGVDWTKTNYTSNVADIAGTLWGSYWRDPTAQELQGLRDNCTWTWVDGSNLKYESGCKLKGFKVTGKGNYSYNSIFLPAGGYYEPKTVYNKGQAMYLWSSSANSSNFPYRLGCQNADKDQNVYGQYVSSDYLGLSVRAVVNE